MRVGSSARWRFVLAAASATAVVVTGLQGGVGAAAVGDDDPGIRLVSPAVGSTMSGTTTVQLAIDGSTHARLGAYFKYSGGLRWLDPQPVAEDGTARFELSTFGLASKLLMVGQRCASSDPTTCEGIPVEWRMLTSNPPPVIEEPTERYLELYPPADGPIQVRASGDGTRISVRTWGRKVDLAPGETGEIDMLGAADYQAEIWATYCHEAWTDICSGPIGLGPWLVVRHALKASVASMSGVGNGAGENPLSVPLLSPNGDWVGETVEPYLRIDRSISYRPTWSLVRNGVRVTGPHSSLKGDLIGTFDTFPINVFKQARKVIPSGLYELVMDFTGRVNGHALRTQARAQIRIDTTAVRVTRFVPSTARFYPRKGGYRDWVKVTGQVWPREQATVTKACVVNARSRCVRRLYGARIVDGRLAGLTWWGTKYDGRLAPAGFYRFRVWTKDAQNNRAVSTGGRVHLSRTRR